MSQPPRLVVVGAGIIGASIAWRLASAGARVTGLVIAPELHISQTVEGRIVSGSDFGGGDPGGDQATTAHRSSHR